jgi:hypothetical protein
MIRANPGLILLKDGVVLGKWHNNDIPTKEANCSTNQGLTRDKVFHKKNSIWIYGFSWSDMCCFFIISCVTW